MQALVLHEFGSPLIWQEIATPQPGPGEVLVEVKACGIDGTDLKLLQGFGYEPDLPFVPGHEIAGIVAGVATDVRHLELGSSVIVYNFETCGRCLMCEMDRTQLCLHMGGVMGVKDTYGGMAEYVRVPAQQVANVPAGLAFTDGATCCDAGMTAFHAVQRGAIQRGESVLVIGVGGVGSFVVQLVTLRGAAAVAVELGSRKLEWARRMGASATIDGNHRNWKARLAAMGYPYGVDCVMDIVGTRATMRSGIEVLRPGGRLVLVGYTPDDLQVAGRIMAQREIQILGTRAGTKGDLQEVAHLLWRGELRSIVRESFPMPQANDALARLQSGHVDGRIVLLAPAYTA